jgi:phosphoribosylamine---glycine ligase
MNILIIGCGAREHAIARAFARSQTPAKLFCFGDNNNPGIRALVEDYGLGSISDNLAVVTQAKKWNIELAIIGPEAPLANGLTDALMQHRIAVVGPSQSLARIETSKSFSRELLERYHIHAAPAFRKFTELHGVQEFLEELGEHQYVVKADGLMGGKGVKVGGEHLHDLAEAYAYCEELLAQGHAFVIEEKLIGQEFSLLCFTDGETMVSMPPVQDHKRAFNDDKGPNTGGMGSYSDANHSLPFLKEWEIEAAQRINNEVLQALQQECGEHYRGVLYGSFIATAHGVFVIEYNARFGDPEALNLLALIETDFTLLCQSITKGTLNKIPVVFKSLASVCKYTVPEGYPDTPQKNIPIDVSDIEHPDQCYYAAVHEEQERLLATGSRAVAVVGLAPTLAEAEKIAESEIQRVRGKLFHRSDIGTAPLVEQRVQMMDALRSKEGTV